MGRKEQAIARLTESINRLNSQISELKNNLKTNIYSTIFSDFPYGVPSIINENTKKPDASKIPQNFSNSTDDYEPDKLSGKIGTVDGWNRTETKNSSNIVTKITYSKTTTIPLNINVTETVVHSDLTYNSSNVVTGYNKSTYSISSSGSILSKINTEVSARETASIEYAQATTVTSAQKKQREKYTKTKVDGVDYPINKGGVGNLTNTLYISEIQLEEYKKKKAEYESGGEIPDPTDINPKSHIEVESQTGHIFPVEMVGNTINKLIDYNNQLANYIVEIEAYEARLREAKKKGIGKINLDFIAKKVELFCKRINYWLAWLRYYLLKGLRGVFNSFKDVIQPISTLIEVVEGLMHLSLKSIISGVAKFGKAFLDIILGPYKEYVQFCVDVETYVPPLAEETIDLVDDVGVAVNKGTALYNELKQEVQNIANTAKNTDLLDPEVSKRLLEKYTNISDGNYKFNIDMESISLSDIISGDDPEKPKWDDFK